MRREVVVELRDEAVPEIYVYVTDDEFGIRDYESIPDYIDEKTLQRVLNILERVERRVSEKVRNLNLLIEELTKKDVSVEIRKPDC